VAVAAARRAGLGEDTIEDVRLAVSEAVARAVVRHVAAGVATDVELVVCEDAAFEIEVRDRTDPSLPDEDDGVALALIRALAPVVSTPATDSSGSTLVLAWPLPS
jgi:anti-sigma regulatory factor (Ser/Thr protein kinase)